jgi:isopenicillin N synthase-like dioxygenase
MPNDLVYIPPADDAVRHGASLSALVELGEQHGYVLVETTLYNAFFVRKDLYEESSRLKHLVPDPSIEALHEVTMGTSLYQLYDGTIKLHGCKKLLWHRVPIDETKIQVLPLHMRRFPYAPPGPEAFHAPTPDPSFNHVESSTPGGKKDSGGGGDDSIFDFSRVIDVSAWRRKVKEGESSSSREEKRRDSSRQLVKELKQCGFCHIRGTGISADLCRKALQVSGRFLHGADENIRRACLARDRARRGYSPPCTENFGCLVGNPSAPNDLVRKFRIGPSSSSSSSTHSSSSTSPLLQPNMWPHPTSWQDANEFRSVTEAYFEAANKAATSVVYAIAAGLVEAHPELEESLFPLFRKHQNGKSRDEETDEIRSWPGENDSIEATTTSILTLLGYTVGSRHKKGHKKGPLVAAHTDVGVLTFLLFDAGSCATLQRHHREASSVVPSARFQAAATSTSTGGASNRGSGSTTTTNATTSSEEWVNVHLPRSVPPDPVFVINVADCLSDLSGGRLPSTLHRVVANRTPPPPITNHPGHSPRTCLALFVGLHPDAPLRIQGESLSYEKWRKRRIERAVKVFKPAAAAVTASGESGDA